MQPGAPGQPTRVLNEASSSVTPPGHTAEDVAFMQGMIAHHEQAILMSGLVEDRTENSRIRTLARRIERSQVEEITLLESWLEDRGERISPGGMTMSTHGMLSQDELTELGEAQGDEFDRLFLTSMIRHHEGAIAMVNELFSNPTAGQGVDVNQIAAEVETDQRIEITRMVRMLTETSQ